MYFGGYGHKLMADIDDRNRSFIVDEPSWVMFFIDYKSVTGLLFQQCSLDLGDTDLVQKARIKYERKHRFVLKRKQFLCLL